MTKNYFFESDVVKISNPFSLKIKSGVLKKLAHLVLILFLAVPASAQFSGGDGSTATPYIITTPAQLAQLATYVNAGDANYNAKFYILGNNIDLSAYGESFNGGAGWIPIGTDATNSFKGNFNGDNKKITGLYTKSIGLFGVVNTAATVKNVHVEGTVISTLAAGGIIGSLQNGSSVLNSSFTGSVTTTSSDAGAAAGGIVGGCSATNTISDCYVIGTVSVIYPGAGVRMQYAGGIVGSLGTGNVSRCYFNGTVNANFAAGGICGVNANPSTISNCYSMGSIEIPVRKASGWVGGITGHINVATITSCWSISKVHGRGSGGYAVLAGGIGARNQNPGKIINCAALNPSLSVDGPGGPESNRIAVQSISPGTFTNNIGFDNMLNPWGTLQWDSKGLNGYSGSDFSIAQILADGTLGGRFTTENGWTVENGKLPGLFGNAVDLPDYMVIPSQTYTLSGKITGNNAPNGIEGAEVTIHSLGLPFSTATTDAQGNYTFPQVVNTKTYTVRGSLPGYAPYSATVEINGNNMEHNITLNNLLNIVDGVTAAKVDDNINISWSKTQPASFRHDSGVSSGTGFDNHQTRGWLVGSAYREGAILTKISWFLTGNCHLVDVYILPITDEGYPKNIDIFRQLNVANTIGQWTEFEFPYPIYAPDGFFIGLCSAVGGSLSLGLDLPNDLYPSKTMTHFYGQDVLKHSDWVPINKAQNLMLRAEGIALGRSQGFGDEGLDDPSRGLQNYTVYRLKQGDPETQWTKLSDNVPSTNYTDAAWLSLPGGSYQWAVKANYSSGVTSLAKLSNVLDLTYPVTYPTYPTLTNGVLEVKDGANTVPSGSMVPKGTTITITAIPDAGYYTGVLKINGQSITSPYNYAVTSATNIQCEFVELGKLPLLLESTPAGTGVLAGAGHYYPNQVVPINAYANQHWKFEEWLDGATQIATTPAFNYTMPDISKTLTAKFVPATYNITYNLAGGTVTPENPTTYNIYTPTFTLNNPTKSGYTFIGWTGSDLTSPTLTVDVPTWSGGDRIYTANWKDLGIESITTTPFDIYPNPVYDNLTVQRNSDDKARIEIYTITGAVVRSVEVCEPITILNVSTLASGMYMIRITDSQNISTLKFVKE